MHAFCDGSCVPTDTDPLHCGMCDNACEAGFSCAGGTCQLVCDPGLTACGAVCQDLSSDMANCGACGRVCDMGGTCTLGECVVERDVVLTFPSAGDPRVAATGIYYWRLGDNVEGTRTAGLSEISRVRLELQIAPNSLTCDNQDVELLLNGTVLERRAVMPGTTVLSFDLPVTVSTGPTVTLRLQTVREVGSGCGSAGYTDDVSMVVLTGR